MALLWGLWYVSTILCSFVYLAGSPLGSRLSLGELVAGSVPVGTICGAWAVYLASCLLGRLTLSSIALGTASMVLAAALNRRRFLREWGHFSAAMPSWGKWRIPLPLTSPDWVCLAMSLAMGYVLWPLYSSRMIPEAHGNIMSGGSCYGDLPIHMQVRGVARGGSGNVIAQG